MTYWWLKMAQVESTVMQNVMLRPHLMCTSLYLLVPWVFRQCACRHMGAACQTCAKAEQSTKESISPTNVVAATPVQNEETVMKFLSKVKLFRCPRMS
eukprot:s621_g21.t1